MKCWILFASNKEQKCQTLSVYLDCPLGWVTGRISSQPCRGTGYSRQMSVSICSCFPSNCFGETTCVSKYEAMYINLHVFVERQANTAYRIPSWTVTPTCADCCEISIKFEVETKFSSFNQEAKLKVLDSNPFTFTS